MLEADRPLELSYVGVVGVDDDGRVSSADSGRDGSIIHSLEAGDG